MNTDNETKFNLNIDSFDSEDRVCTHCSALCTVKPVEKKEGSGGMRSSL